jgi:hypothetical protein
MRNSAVGIVSRGELIRAFLPTDDENDSRTARPTRSTS